MAAIQTAANSPAAQWPRRRAANGAPQTAAKTGSQAGRVSLSAALSALQARHDFAMDLIAAKSINTCDGGVFRGVEFAPENGALCALLRAASPLRRGLRAAIPQAVRHLPVGTKSAARNAARNVARNAAAGAAKTVLKAGRAPLFAALSALRIGYSFATGLIAAKSINTCDGGVFRGVEFAPKNGALCAPLRAVSPLRRGLRAAIPQAARHLSVGTKSAARNATRNVARNVARNAAAGAAKTVLKAGRAPVSAALSALQARHDFATGLIAAKSINTCDGGVFRGVKFAPENGAKYAGLRLGGRRQAGSRSARCP